MLMKNTKYMGIIFGITLFITSIVCCKKELLSEPQANKQVVTIIDTTKKTLVVTAKDSSKTTTPIVVTKDSTKTVVPIAINQTLSADFLKTFTSAAGDNDYFKITTNTSWKIASFPVWVTVSPLTGTGNGKITVTVQANTGIQRNGSIKIAGTGVSQAVSVNTIQVAAAAAAVPPTSAQANYYIAVNGSDNNAGTIDKPFASLNGAWKVVKPGSLIYMRGGTYSLTTQQALTGKSGTAGNLIKIWAYPGETPIITKGSGFSASSGIYISNSNYLHIKGLEVTGFNQPSSGGNVGGFYIEPSNNSIFELINYHHNGFPLTATHASTGNLFLNCDFHHNYDPYTIGDKYGNADGVNCEFDPGTSNVFRGCRSWWNSDDGFDFYRCDGYVEFDNCWAWHNGYKEDGVTAGGNGTGFKLGITRADFHTQVLRYVHNCLAWDGRQGGFYQADGNCIMRIYNNTSYKNTGDKYTCGFGFKDFDGIAHIIKNNIALDEMVAYFGNSAITSDHNSWESGVGVSDKDFISLDQTGTNGERQADGSLPNINFLKLKTTSGLYQKGVDVGLPFSGSAPSLGANRNY